MARINYSLNNSMTSRLFEENFYYFQFFYLHLRYRVLIALFLSLMVGLLDGIGLALFIPLLNIAVGNIENSNLQSDTLSQFVMDTLRINPNLLNIFLLIFLLFCVKGIFKFLESYLRVVYQQFFMRKIRDENIALLSEYDYQRFVLSDAWSYSKQFKFRSKPGKYCLSAVF